MGELTVEPVFVAIDGGGSKTDAYAVAPDGRVLAAAHAGGSSPQIIGLDDAVAVIDDLLDGLLAQLSLRRADRVNAYLSGLDLPEEIDAFRRAVSTKRWLPARADEFVAENDTFALLRAGTEERNAVAVVCGTGMNTVGVTERGDVVRFPALGTISGDWGGGWSLGESALWHAVRAADGRGPESTLVESIPAMFGVADLDAVVRGLHFGSIDPNSLSRLAPAVLAASREGDGIAAGLVDRQADEIVSCAVAALRRLDLLGVDAPVVLGGGVVASGDARLLDRVQAGLAVQAPRGRMRLVVDPPVLGALLLTLESAGCDAEAVERVGADFGGRRDAWAAAS